MAIVLLVATVFLALETTNSYILLTANLEDVHAIAKQLAESPVAAQVKQIWRRAASQFNQHLVKSTSQKKPDDMDIDSKNRDDKPPGYDEESGNRYYGDANRIERRDELEDGMKNASYYLSSIKKIMDGI